MTGPFTVESLSPHRILPAGSDASPAERAAAAPPRSARQLRADDPRQPPQGRREEHEQEERPTFDRLDPFPGEYIQAEGDDAETGGGRARCASARSSAPSACRLKKAARKRSRAAGCDLLLVCGFAFDPHVHEQTAELTKEISSAS